jgi:hypothetical protein
MGLFTSDNRAQTRPVTDSTVGETARPPISAKRVDSTLLVDVQQTARVLGWEAKVVVPGKLLTLCRDDRGVCIPIRLERVAFRAGPREMYVEAAAVARALGIHFKKLNDESVTFEPAAEESIASEIPAYHADWGPDRGFRFGQTLPDIPLTDLEGHEVRFSQFLGTRYILYCWASW